MSAVRYYQLLNQVLSSAAALAYDPVTVNRLRRISAPTADTDSRSGSKIDLCLNLPASAATSRWTRRSSRFHLSGWGGFDSISTIIAGNGPSKSSGCTAISPAP
ncbi:DUF3263 domain-containing protein [Mycobacterium intracellulare]|uniref:DUF3263 domain-containing protein n=1 Tax=Mycobacterium intracellulare TaxID=1767 RepID=UPI001CD95C54|nr:DUF3263 domain-containing protein [Mycobacterium intracellulare]